MAFPVHIQRTTFFYAIGNTPAVCLTQSLPPDQDAALLLLGCGDVRSILFTAYAGIGSDRDLDITCCDIEAEIIARNIILFTLIIDDVKSENIKRIWDIYYHFQVDDDSLGLLREQASRLKGIASTAEGWNNGNYGHILRFCDSYTFSQVMRLWDFYALQPCNGSAFEEQQKQLKQGIEKAKSIQAHVIGDGIVTTGARSMAPLFSSGIEGLSKFYKDYWKNGTTATDEERVRQSKNLNPMFGALSKSLVLHYGTDPILGYSLAPAFAPLSEQSPLSPDSPTTGEPNTIIRVVIAQFDAYAKAVRSSVGRLTIRFVNADALAFCHTLQHIQEYGTSTPAWWYRSTQCYTPLTLDSGDYSQRTSNSPAPLCFDIVDTSNLVDHLGCLNLLAAAGPLLSPKPTSTLSTEMLVLRERDVDQYAKSLVCGDLSTVALLFGLIPTQYWTGTCATSSFSEYLANSLKKEDPSSMNTQSRYILLWKSLGLPLKPKGGPSIEERVPGLSFDPKELATLMYRVYLRMFQDESWVNTLSKSPEQHLRSPYKHYTRASLVAILGLIHGSGSVDWNGFMSRLYELIVEDTTLNMSPHYIQELNLHLHTLGLHKLPAYQLSSLEVTYKEKSPFRNWKNIPSTLCLTMVVPRRKISVFENASVDSGSPSAHIMLQCRRNQRENIFPGIQLGFGKLRTSGANHTESLTLKIEDDPQGWDGTAPLIVSVMIPSWLVFQYSDLSTKVIFALKSTPAALFKFCGKLGMLLEIARSTIAGKDIFITKYRPNMSGHMSLSANMGSTEREAGPSESSKECLTESVAEETSVQFHAALDPNESKLANITAHVDIFAESSRDMLRSGAAVKISQISPFEVAIIFDSGQLVKQVRLPVPINMVGSVTRIARKSSYVEFVAPVAPQVLLSRRPDSLYLVSVNHGIPTVRNPHYISLDHLPILNISRPLRLGWLTPHLADMFSAKERSERDKSMELSTKCENLRARFKDSLFTLFMQVTGAQGGMSYSVFGLDNRDNGGIHALIFPACLRLDMTNQTVVLDAAMVPLTAKNMPELRPLLRSIKSPMCILVDDEEFVLWKHALPVFVERCRDWKHSKSCEYGIVGKIPISVSNGQQTICSCGKGKFPDDYQIKASTLWKRVSKYAVRVAISPCFSVPFVEKSFQPECLAPRKSVRAFAKQEADRTMDAVNPKAGVCSACGRKEAENGGALLTCSGCKFSQYCSKGCQAEHWKNGQHKTLCRLYQGLHTTT
ncbi:uncharacterized protein CIMG_03846 [Coccidioides immitis RS]|uniref:MYND-type domain-containing protein n=2 Tax=Coccidioides immitis TaxID=5501 RepID=J3KC89_COCIM|nr:uncharacterized protein CIMG_03846 [Coccidioides immitis RS]EAS32822.3 hypothetical protein CIMG_03846 [Coccidioides immitis RS]KMP08086.1 hypothetical protein CIRG_07767 [Coccidioides immitis RMSCC 2394]TPX19814.1 hypothetical protein DIZ76_017606 [Coccidioides immitis]